MKQDRVRWIIGIDEVGRGALAGPVVVAAAMLPARRSFSAARLGPLKDSKRLTPAQRARWSSYLLNAPQCMFALARVYPRGIEKNNISRAANLAAARAFARLQKTGRMRSRPYIILDGGLYLGNGGRRQFLGKTMIKADERINAVKAASIVAKVYRDRLMVYLAKKHPEYGFEIHKGYGTRAHREAIKKHGPTPAHRLTFLKNFVNMDTYGRRTS